MASLEVMHNGVEYGNGGLVQVSNGVKVSDNLGVDFQNDLDSYMHLLILIHI